MDDLTEEQFEALVVDELDASGVAHPDAPIPVPFAAVGPRKTYAVGGGKLGNAKQPAAYVGPSRDDHTA